MTVVDRIEEGTVILDCDGVIFGVDIEKFALPVREGDVVAEDNGLYKSDAEATEKRRNEIIEKMKRMGLK